MQLIDPRTVIVMAASMSGMMSGVFYALRRRYPASIQGLGEWSAAMMAFFVGGVLFAGRGVLPDLIALPLPNFLMFVGMYVGYLGIARFFGEMPRILPHAVCLLVALVLMVWFSSVEPSTNVRLRIANMAMTYLFGLCMLTVLMQPEKTFARLFTAGILGGAALVQVMRLVSSFTAPDHNNLFDPSLLNLVYLTSFAFAMLLFSVSAMLMVSERLLIELEHMAMRDPLTNVWTRRHMDTLIAAELTRCRRHHRQVSLMMMDLDHFKRINDSFGHQVGDQVLIDFVKKVHTMLRQQDQLCRFGGEEFVVLMPETSLDEATQVARRLCQGCAPSSDRHSCTVSIGVATLQSDSDTPAILLGRADAALYLAKNNGRNRVETG